MEEEEAQLLTTRHRSTWMALWNAFVEELRSVSFVAAPMVVVTVSRYLVQVVSFMMVGHLDELSLSAVGIASSFTNVTGFSLLLGMAGALDTLCGQAYGAQEYHMLGNFLSCAMVSLVLVCIPISVVWMFMDKLLVLLGQNHQISQVARQYAVWLIPALCGYAVLQALIHYLLSQSLILAMLMCSCATLCLHIPICWVLVYKLEFGIVGAALAIGLTYWFNVIFLGMYVKYSSTCAKTRILISRETFGCIKQFFKYAVPSAWMVCLEWWSYELLILLSGVLSNPRLAVSVISICLSVDTLQYLIPYSIGAALSCRVSNALGAGNPQAVKFAISFVTSLSALEAASVSIILFCCRDVLGYAYSTDDEVVDSVAKMVPLLCLSIFVDGILTALCGVIRGSGRQYMGAYVNAAAYYVVGIPVACILCFVLHLNEEGLWIGILIAASLQTIYFGFITVSTNWQKQAADARNRVSEATSLIDDSPDCENEHNHFHISSINHCYS